MKQIKYIPKIPRFDFIVSLNLQFYNMDQSVMYSKMWLCVNIYMLHDTLHCFRLWSFDTDVIVHRSKLAQTAHVIVYTSHV